MTKEQLLREALDKYMHARTPEDHALINEAAREYLAGAVSARKLAEFYGGKSK